MKIPIRLVLDTNIVLDWLVFDDSRLSLFRRALRDGDVVVLSYCLALAELQRVLAYPALQLGSERQAELALAYRMQTLSTHLPVEFSTPQLMLPPGFPLCRDADDRHFLAFTYYSKADALISRDKAVLSLSRRAAPFGMKVMDLEQLAAMLHTRFSAAPSLK